MKALINKIDKLTETVEMGLLTKEEAMFEIRKMRSNILHKFAGYLRRLIYKAIHTTPKC